LPYDGPGDPTEALWYLKAVASKVSVVGQEQVRGTPTTRYAVTMKVPDELTPGPMTIETTLDLYDFGVPVHVTPPPANQVEVIRPELPRLAAPTRRATAQPARQLPPRATPPKPNHRRAHKAGRPATVAHRGHRDSVPWAGRSLDPQPSTQPLTIGPISVQALVPGSPGPA
jgi:hypothetical protein